MTLRLGAGEGKNSSMTLTLQLGFHEADSVLASKFLVQSWLQSATAGVEWCSSPTRLGVAELTKTPIPKCLTICTM
jgi:hypothetical protein